MYMVINRSHVSIFFESKILISNLGVYCILLWNLEIQNIFYYNNDDFTFNSCIIDESCIKI